MAIIAPQGRQPLAADALLRLVRSGFATIPDHRRDEVDMAFTEALRSGCARFSLTSPALLACDNQRVEGTLATIYGIPHAPCDTRMRERRDPVSPESLRAAVKRVLRQLQRGKAREEMGWLDGSSRLALDGTGSFASQTMHCDSCRHKGQRNGAITDDHHLLGAAMLHPERRAVIPLLPEPMIQQDGTENNDGERHAAKRFLTQWRHEHPHRTCIVTADRRSAHAPHIETRHDAACHALLGGKEGEHTSVCNQVPAAEDAGAVTYDARHDRATGVVQRFRFVHAMPRNASSADVRGNCIAYGERTQDQVQPCSWVTDLRVSTRHVYKRMQGGRARGQIAHETFHTLKNQGDNFAHTYGHGEKHRAVVFATLMLLAFCVDQTPQWCCALCHAVGVKRGRTRVRWERRRALLYDDALTSMRQLFEALLDGFKKSHPIMASDAS